MNNKPRTSDEVHSIHERAERDMTDLLMDGDIQTILYRVAREIANGTLDEIINILSMLECEEWLRTALPEDVIVHLRNILLERGE